MECKTRWAFWCNCCFSSSNFQCNLWTVCRCLGIYHNTRYTPLNLRRFIWKTTEDYLYFWERRIAIRIFDMMLTSLQFVLSTDMTLGWSRCLISTILWHPRLDGWISSLPIFASFTKKILRGIQDTKAQRSEGNNLKYHLKLNHLARAGHAQQNFLSGRREKLTADSVLFPQTSTPQHSKRFSQQTTYWALKKSEIIPQTSMQNRTLKFTSNIWCINFGPPIEEMVPIFIR